MVSIIYLIWVGAFAALQPGISNLLSVSHMVPIGSLPPPLARLADRYCQWVRFSDYETFSTISFTVKDGSGSCGGRAE